VIGRTAAIVFAALIISSATSAQTPPSSTEISGYAGLHAAAWSGDAAQIRALVDAGADPNAVDGAGRTPLHVAAFASHDDTVRALVAAGADPNLLENGRYDIITIAAVADDPDLVRLGIELGGNPGNITSIYDGTALIAAAHLGHVEVVEALIKADAPLDHVNNLGWTALMEAVVLGDGGERHTNTVRALVDAGADRTIADRRGVTPLDHAKQRGYAEMVAILE
jgi:ankyrin repeat protein